jgi:hypothetical protein
MESNLFSGLGIRGIRLSSINLFLIVLRKALMYGYLLRKHILKWVW